MRSFTSSFFLLVALWCTVTGCTASRHAQRDVSPHDVLHIMPSTETHLKLPTDLEFHIYVEWDVGRGIVSRHQNAHFVLTPESSTVVLGSRRPNTPIEFHIQLTTRVEGLDTEVMMAPRLIFLSWTPEEDNPRRSGLVQRDAEGPLYGWKKCRDGCPEEVDIEFAFWVDLGE